MMTNVKSRSTRDANNFLGRRGTIWQAGYHDRAVRSDENLAVVAQYIVANPVTPGIVARVGDYPLWDAVWL